MLIVAEDGVYGSYITADFNTLVALQQMQALMLHLYIERYNFNRQLLCEAIHFSGHVYRRRRKQRSARKLWVKPGRTTVWWDGFAKGIVLQKGLL